MSYGELLFSNIDLPRTAILNDPAINNSNPFVFPNENDDWSSFKEYIDGWVLESIAPIRRFLPRYMWKFNIPYYNADNIDDKYIDRRKKAVAIELSFLKHMIKEKNAELMYLCVETSEVYDCIDNVNSIEINLNDYNFTPGNEPKEFCLYSHTFYRFVLK